MNGPGETSLRDRLLRTRRGSAARPEPEPALAPADAAEPTPAALPAPEDDDRGGMQLRRLEQALVGDAGEGLSLKQRLERLVAAATVRERARRPVVPPIEELVPGRSVRNERGSFYQVEHDTPLDALHGEVPLARLRAASSAGVTILAGEPPLLGFELGRAAYLDTETTGLAGGTGTAAFLIGLGFVEGDRFVVRQYFMRDYDEEPAMLLALAQDLARFSEIVTFNGKLFDVPLLESRYRLNRDRFPLEAVAHLDLLHPARRLWKLRLESCRLQALESALLGVRRRDDIPGDMIPQAYFGYVRSKDARAVARIVEHNRIDIVSLAALSALACQWVDEGRAEDPRDVFSLARVLERAGQIERSSVEYQRALALDHEPLHGKALLRLASQARRAGDAAAALPLWERAAQAGECEAFRALAVHHERTRRDPRSALLVVEEALLALGPREERCCARSRRELLRRRERLTRRLARGRPDAPGRPG
jgi:uncharacterized protein